MLCTLYWGVQVMPLELPPSLSLGPRLPDSVRAATVPKRARRGATQGLRELAGVDGS